MKTALRVLACGFALGCGETSSEVCRVSGGATDLDRALGWSTCRNAAGTFERVLREPPPPGELVLARTPKPRPGSARVERGRWALTMPGREAFQVVEGWGSGEAFFSEVPWAAAAHEIGHLLLIARFFPDFEPETGRYGSPLADWIEEGVAIRHESVEHIEARLVEFRKAGRFGDLASLFAREHRLAKDGGAAYTLEDVRSPCQGACPGRAQPDKFMVIRRRMTRDRELLPPDTTFLDAAVGDSIYGVPEFDGASIAALLFAEQAGGPSLIREMVRGLVKDPADLQLPHRLLAEALNTDSAGVEGRWREWLTSWSPPER